MMGEADRQAQLSEAIADCRKKLRRSRRVAGVVWLLAGGAIGTCLYLGKTRFYAFFDSARWPLYFSFVGMTVGLILLATRYEREARGWQARLGELERQAKGTTQE